MARTLAEGRVTRGLRFAIATQSDDAAIRRLLSEAIMDGAVRLTFEREPDYFLGANRAGGVDRTIVAYEGDKLVCMGRCSKRWCWVNGSKMRVGYLAELRLGEAARGRIAVLRNGYEFFRMTEADDTGVFFTSIGTDNERARSLLERGVRGLPRYEFLGELATVLIAVPRRVRPSKLRLENAQRESSTLMIRFLNEHGCRRQLAPVWGTRLPHEKMFVAWDGDHIAGVFGLWDQRGFRQTRVHGYSFLLSLVRPAANFASGLFGTMRLPRRGSTLAHAFLSPIEASEPLFFPELVAAALPIAAETGLDFLTVGLPANDARLNELKRRFSTRVWRSRLYRVSWPDTPRSDFDLVGGTVHPEVALL